MMRATIAGGIAAVALLVFAATPASAAPWWMRWGRGGHGAHGYDPNTFVSLELTVRSARLSPPAPSLECEMGLGEAVSVVLGPPWYLEQSGIAFAPGDRVRVEGSRLMEDSGRMVVVAATVRKMPDGPILRLRDEKGMPAWGGMGGRHGPGPGMMR
jgi:hypothetical protein